MSFIGSLRKAASNVGRFIGSTGTGALRKIGDTAKSVKSFAGKVNDMTGGAAGIAYNAAKMNPVFGKLATGVEAGLDAAIKGSDMVLKEIDLGQRASNVRSFDQAKGIYNEGRSLYKQVRRP